jgi:hypothetical protein
MRKSLKIPNSPAFLMSAITVVLLFANPASLSAEPWPIKEFEVVNVEPSGDFDWNSYGTTFIASVARAIRQSGLGDPDFPGIFETVELLEVSCDSEDFTPAQCDIEAVLRLAAAELEALGFPPPRLEPVVTGADGRRRYRVYLVTGLDDASGEYHPKPCEEYFREDIVILLDADRILTERHTQLTLGGAQTVAHELVHAVQGGSRFFAGCQREYPGSWITEGQARAMGWAIAEKHRPVEYLVTVHEPDRQRTIWGQRNYSDRMPVPDTGVINLAAYATASFWRFLAEAQASGISVAASPGIHPMDFTYLRRLLDTEPVARDCVGRGAACEAEIAWIDEQSDRLFRKPLWEMYSRFIQAYALWGNPRLELGEGMTNPDQIWLRDSFDRDRGPQEYCRLVELGPDPESLQHTVEVPRFEPVSAQCFRVGLSGFEDSPLHVAITARLHIVNPLLRLDQLTAVLADGSLRLDRAIAPPPPPNDLPRTSWNYLFPNYEETLFLLTNVADEAEATRALTNMSVTFTVLEPGAIVSFGSSVSGQNPLDDVSGGAGQYEVPPDRLKFAVQYVSPDGNACVGGINLPSAVGDGQDLVAIWGGFPLPLAEGEFPIEPPTYPERDFPAPPAPVTAAIRPGVLGAQVFFSCEHGGCGEAPWGAPVRPIDDFRGTFRISKITRTQVIGSFDMVAVDEPVRVSATFLAPLGGPQGLSPGHPCAPVESVGTDAGPQTPPDEGGRSGQPSANGPDDAPGPDEEPEESADLPPDAEEANTGLPTDSDSRPDTDTSPSVNEHSAPPAEPRPHTQTGADSSSREAQSEPLVETQRMGTIEATVEGDARTWYVVEAWTNTGRYASGRWNSAEGAGNLTLVVEGFDTQALPLGDFKTTENGNPSFGSYRGSVIMLTVPVSGDGGSISLNLSDDESRATVSYIPDAGAGSPAHYVSDEGSLNGDWAVSDAGTMRLHGRFEGVFRSGSGDETIRIENGSFAVQDIPPNSILPR